MKYWKIMSQQFHPLSCLDLLLAFFRFSLELPLCMCAADVDTDCVDFFKFPFLLLEKKRSETKRTEAAHKFT
jgi:hypothetical protein